MVADWSPSCSPLGLPPSLPWSPLLPTRQSSSTSQCTMLVTSSGSGYRPSLSFSICWGRKGSRVYPRHVARGTAGPTGALPLTASTAGDHALMQRYRLHWSPRDAAASCTVAGSGVLVTIPHHWPESLGCRGLAAGQRCPGGSPRAGRGEGRQSAHKNKTEQKHLQLNLGTRQMDAGQACAWGLLLYCTSRS